MSILDKLDEIGEYEPTVPEVPVEEEKINKDYLNEQLLNVGILFIIAVGVMVLTIKDKKKLRSKITR